MLDCNLIGGVELLIAGAIMLAVDAAGAPTWGRAVFGSVCILLDLGYRLSREEQSLFHPLKGGCFIVFPIWLMGFVSIGTGFTR